MPKKIILVVDTEDTQDAYLMVDKIVAKSKCLSFEIKDCDENGNFKEEN